MVVTIDGKVTINGKFCAKGPWINFIIIPLVKIAVRRWEKTTEFF